MENFDLTSFTGVVALTFVVVQSAKAWASSTPYVKSIPVVVLTVLVACLLSLLAHAAGYMSGPIIPLLAKAALAALGSSGLYSAISGSSMQSLEKTQDNGNAAGTGIVNKSIIPPGGGKIILLVFGLSMLVGCQQQPVTIYYNTKLTYVAALQELENLREQHIVSESVNEQAKVLRKVADVALIAWKAAITSKNDAGASKAQKEFQAALDAINAIIANYKK